MTDTETPAVETTVADPLAEYKARVRQLAVKLKARFDWCLDETNEHLEALDLEPLPEPRQFTFEATTTGVVRYTVTATSEDEARAIVERQHAPDVRRTDTARSYDRGPRNGILVSLKYNDGGPKLREVEDADS